MITRDGIIKAMIKCNHFLVMIAQRSPQNGVGSWKRQVLKKYGKVQHVVFCDDMCLSKGIVSSMQLYYTSSFREAIYNNVLHHPII